MKRSEVVSKVVQDRYLSVELRLPAGHHKNEELVDAGPW